MKLYVFFWCALLCNLLVVAGMSGKVAGQDEQIRQLQADGDSLRRDMLVYGIERQVLTSNRRLKPAVTLQIAVAIVECSKINALDPWLLFATMKQESRFNPQIIGAVGERGLMQIRRGTAADLGLAWDEAFNITANTCAGAAYLSRHVRERGMHAGLLRYNGGAEPRYPNLVLAHYPAALGAH
jgi:soluble lytic murein transglycosylase-like protein